MTRANQNARRRKGGWAKVLVATTLFAGMVSGALANPADPQTLEEVNRSRRAYAALTQLERSMANAPEALSSSKESISKTILLLTFQTLSIERIKRILKWTALQDPLLQPGTVPESGHAARPSFIFGRVQDWQAISLTEVSLEVVWTPFFRDVGLHYIETQWYRKNGDAWYLYKQDRRQIPGCNKWPRCVAEEA